MLKRTFILAALCSGPAFADPAKVNSVNVAKIGGSYTFDVTVSHGDTGWDDYVDAWRIKDEAGNVYGTRKLAHPHVNEQPFTRSLSGVTIPDNVRVVFVDAHDNVTGWSPQSKRVTLP